MTGSWMMEIFVLATGNCRGVEIRASTEKYRNLREWEKGRPLTKRPVGSPKRQSVCE